MKQRDQIVTGDLDLDSSRVAYMFFISVVAVLSFIVALGYLVTRDVAVKQVLLILDTVYALIFFIDFLVRWRKSTDRRRYMLRWGWFDLITCVPGFPALRIVRSIATVRSARALFQETPSEVEEMARNRLAESVLFFMLIMGLIVVTIGSVLIVLVEEGAPGATIQTGQDAVWWSLVTISTVGYGDEVPVTAQGRIIGVFMIVVGVALFTTITSYLASLFTGREAQKQRAKQIELSDRNARKLDAMLEQISNLERRLEEKSGKED